MKYTITHRTLYHYSSGVALCHNQAWLLPRKRAGSVAGPAVSPSNHGRRCPPSGGFFRQSGAVFAIQDIHQRLEVTLVTEVQVLDARPFGPSSPSMAWEQAGKMLRKIRPRNHRGAAVRAGFAVRGFASAFAHTPNPVFHRAAAVGRRGGSERRINGNLFGDPHFTTTATPLGEVLSERRGVCQDFAHLGIACLRALGLAARYVSGYLETIPPPGQRGWSAPMPRTPGWRSTSGHRLGEFDPTNDCMPENGTSPGLGPDYGDVAPLTGVMTGGGSHSLEVSVDVEPHAEPASKGRRDTEFRQIRTASTSHGAPCSTALAVDPAAAPNRGVVATTTIRSTPCARAASNPFLGGRSADHPLFGIFRSQAVRHFAEHLPCFSQQRLVG